MIALRSLEARRDHVWQSARDKGVGDTRGIA
jgi:hypothetical protein